MGHSSRFPAIAAGAAIVVAVILAAGVPFGTILPVLAALACPLAMVFMMRGMHGLPAPDHGAPGREVESPDGRMS